MTLILGQRNSANTKINPNKPQMLDKE